MGQVYPGPPVIGGEFDLPAISLANFPLSGFFSLNDGLGLSLSGNIAYLQTKSLYQIGPKALPTGVLAPLVGNPLATGAGPTGVVTHPSGKFLYVSSQFTNTIYAYNIVSSNGQLQQIVGSPFATAASPSGLWVSHNGKFLFVTNQIVAGTVSVFTINQATGALTPVAGSPFAAGLNPISVVGDPLDKFLYVLNNLGSISAYTINPLTGALVPVAGSPFAVAGSLNGACVHPTANFLYVGSSTGLHGFQINQANGSLTRTPNSPITGSIFIQPLSDPLGRFIWATNPTLDAVSAFVVNAINGDLSPVQGGPFPTGLAPQGMAIDPAGEMLVVANANSNSVSTFLVNDITGILTPVAGSPFAVGAFPYNVCIDPTSKFCYVTNLNGASVSMFSTSATIQLPLIEGTFDQTGGIGGNRLNINGDFLVNGVEINNPARLLSKSGVAVIAPNDLLENVLATINVPALHPNDQLRLYVLATCTNNANVKTIRARLGGIGGVAYEAVNMANNVSLSFVTEIVNRNAVNSQIGPPTVGYGLSVNPPVTSAVDTSVPQTIVLTAQKAVAGDVMVLECFLCEIISDGT